LHGGEPVAAQPQLKEFYDDAYRWMDGWMGGGMWTVIGILVVVLLVVAINKLSKK